MSIKNKIVLSFLISSSIIAVLIIFEYLNFIRIRKEIGFLELSDTIRNKSLQLRRHENNYFLYSPKISSSEFEAIFVYLNELEQIFSQNENIPQLKKLKRITAEYRVVFTGISQLVGKIYQELEQVQTLRQQPFYSFLELTFLEHPLEEAKLLEIIELFSSDHPVVIALKQLAADITRLRKTGEELLVLSNEMDKSARDTVHRTIYVSQLALLIFFPLFVVVGTVILFLIVSRVTSRLKLLTNIVKQTGQKGFQENWNLYKKQEPQDEVGILVTRFREMRQQLLLREEQLYKQTMELLRSKKLAAIGTFASGIAHEINNPLNNISISLQVLRKSAGEQCSREVKVIISDILGQTDRIKNIVKDLLDFAKVNQLNISQVNLRDLVKSAFRQSLSGNEYDKDALEFQVEPSEGSFFAEVDSHQLERVLVNLFINAFAAMSGQGILHVAFFDEGETILVQVKDNGKGMDSATQERIFEPFFTTKEKGTGLGLSLVFSTITQHMGTIKVESIQNKGTLFSIKLPKKQLQK